MTGTIKNMVAKKGFGFIKADGKEYFFHRDDFVGHWDDLVNDHETSNEPIEVLFERQESPKGPRAARVRRADHPNQAV